MTRPAPKRAASHPEPATSARHAALVARARALADLAAERSEAQLLRAAVWLELRAAAHACAGTLERIAIHYLLLTEHPDVLAQPGLAARYARCAAWWADLASAGDSPVRGPSARADA